jgi:hypothetical protein
VEIDGEKIAIHGPGAAQNLIAAKLTPNRSKKLVSESTKALKTLLK